MRRPGLTWVRRIAESSLIIAVLAGLSIANYRLALRAPGGNDFLARWVGANQWLVSGRNPYDPQVSLMTQIMIYGRPADRAAGEDVAHFAYPLFSMLFFGPFGLLPYTVARALWMTVLEVALPILAIMGMRLAGWKPSAWIQRILILFSVLWYHGFRAVILGQFAVLEALLMIGALLAIQHRQDRAAGVLIGLSLAKPQMAALLIALVFVWALASRRTTVLIWSLATIAVLLGASMALIPDWPILWIRQIIDYTTYTETAPPVSILAGLIPSAAGAITTALTGLALLYLILEWARTLGKGDRWFQWTAALTIVITHLVVLRTATTNYVVMFPALILIFSVWAERWGAAGNAAILIALGILFLGTWALFLTTVEGNLEHPALYLPLPLLVLAGLWWSKWWIVRQLRF